MNKITSPLFSNWYKCIYFSPSISAIVCKKLSSDKKENSNLTSKKFDVGHFTHVLFDLDDTETVYKRIYGDVVRQFGKEYTTEVRIQHVGTPGYMTARIICKLLDLPITWEEFLRISNEKLRDVIGHCPLMPGVKRLLSHLASHKIPLAIATSSSQKEMELKMSGQREIEALFHHIVTAESDPEVKRPKPAPDVFLVAAARFPRKPPPSQVLVFEDSLSGVQAALAAEMTVVATPDPAVPRDKFEGAARVLASLDDFHPHEFGFPPF